MDKVTQCNAASAEESASAAEELNAQAATLATAVEELITLVGGSARATEPNADFQRPATPDTGQQEPAAPSRTIPLPVRVGSERVHPVSPEAQEAIPFPAETEKKHAAAGGFTSF
jgi:methyl-accepting chemotaxis protein